MSSILPDLTPSRSRPPEPLAATSVDGACSPSSLSYSSPSTRVSTPAADHLTSIEGQIDEEPARSSGGGKAGGARSAKDLETGGGGGKEEVELNRTEEVNDDEEEEVWTYPDGGRKAWSVVLGCFIYAGSTMVSRIFPFFELKRTRREQSSTNQRVLTRFRLLSLSRFLTRRAGGSFGVSFKQ